MGGKGTVARHADCGVINGGDIFCGTTSQLAGGSLMFRQQSNAAPVTTTSRRWLSPDLVILGVALVAAAAVVWAYSTRAPSLSRLGGTWKPPFWR